MTTKLYLVDMAVLSSKAQIVGLVPGDKPTVRMDQTIFHPQGGGQKADLGHLGSARVLHVVNSGKWLDHVVDSLAGLSVGAEVWMAVDGPSRNLNALFHTCTHHIVNVIEALYPPLHVVAGHSWPGEARVEFAGNLALTSLSVEAINERVAADLRSGLPVRMVGDPFESRAMAIGNYPAIACGGTHIASLEEVLSSHVTAIRARGARLRVSFDCVPKL